MNGTTVDFSTEEAAKLARMPLDRVISWHKTAFLSASVAAKRRGVSRRYTFRDVVALRVAGELRASGVTLRTLRKVVDHLRAREGLSATDVLTSINLVTNGGEVYEVAGEVSLHVPSGQRVIGFYVIPLDQVVSDIQRKLRALRRAA